MEERAPALARGVGQLSGILGCPAVRTCSGGSEAPERGLPDREETRGQREKLSVPGAETSLPRGRGRC